MDDGGTSVNGQTNAIGSAPAYFVPGAQVKCLGNSRVCGGCLACIMQTSEQNGAWRERQRIASALRERGKPN